MLVFISNFISIDKPNCHFERAKRVEKSKSCKYNKYPELTSTKTALFMDDTPIFPFPSTKTAIFMDRKRQPKAVLSGRLELNYVKAVR